MQNAEGRSGATDLHSFRLSTGPLIIASLLVTQAILKSGNSLLPITNTSRIMSAKMLATVFGVVFVLVGLLGFVGNPIVGSMGIFMTNHAHDVVHLLIGIVLLVVAYTAPAMSALWLKIVGVVYLLIAILGFVMIPSGGDLLGFISMNMADHWLHVVLGIVIVAAGFWASDSRPMAAMPSSM
jgi:hypothetical protein